MNAFLVYLWNRIFASTRTPLAHYNYKALAVINKQKQNNDLSVSVNSNNRHRAGQNAVIGLVKYSATIINKPPFNLPSLPQCPEDLGINVKLNIGQTITRDIIP